jgi:hypothetical protein
MEHLRAALLELIKRSRTRGCSDLQTLPFGPSRLLEMSRRQFVKLSAGTAFASAPVLRLLNRTTADPTSNLSRPVFQQPQDGAYQHVLLELLRPDDLINLTFEFLNLRLRNGKTRNLIKFLTGHKPYPPVLERVDAKQPAFVVVHFPPQHISEKAFFEDASESTADLPLAPVQARFSGASRLAFVLPPNVERIDTSPEVLLDWSSLIPSIVPTALARGDSTTEAIRPPQVQETAIELPARLLLSPNPYSGWKHSKTPISRRDNGRKITWTELWHTQLSVRLPGQDLLSDSNDYFRTVRAIYSLDSRGVGTPPPACHEDQDPPSARGAATGLDAMSERDRFEIVQLSSNFNDLRAGETGEPIEPEPIQIDRLLLTSQGAWISSQGDWEPADLAISGKARPEGLSLRQWRQESSAGRDTFVRLVYGGFLYPYGHRANLIQVTERRFQRKNPTSPFKAYLRQRIFITVEQPIVEYGDAGLDPDGNSIDRQMPFVSIECTTASTPSLDRPAHGDLKYPCYFWPRVLSKYFHFHFRGLDNTGHQTEFTSPVIFFEYGQRRDAAAIAAVVQAFKNSQEDRRPFAGQKLAFTPEHEAGDATLEADFVHFSAYPALAPPANAIYQHGPNSEGIEVSLVVAPTDSSASDLSPILAGSIQQDVQHQPPTASGVCCSDKPPRKPPRAPWKTHVPKAEVKSPSLKGLAGPSLDTSIPIKWDPHYLKHGFTFDPGSPNLGHLFAGVDLPNLRFSLPEANAVGLFRPDFDISGFSRKFGAVGGDLNLLKLGNFNPSAFFGDSAKFLGAIKLSNLFASNLDFSSLGTQVVPPFKTRVIKDASGIPIRVENYIDWEPQLTNAPGDTVAVTVGSDTSANVQVLVATQVKAGETKQSLNAEIRNITVSIAKAIDIEFKRISFASGDGQGTNVKVEPGQVKFRGGLAFVASLQEKFGSSLWGAKGPRITFENGAVVVKASFALPNIAFGVFSLQHLTLAPNLNLPVLGGTPLSVGIDVASREDPFLVGVGILAGGGYLLLRFGGDGIQFIEFSIEAGAHVALDLGVAHGSAYVLVGVGMRYDRANPKKGLELMLFLKAGGSFSVIGIITVSIQFTLTFTYAEGQGDVTANCTVTVSIDILFFHTDVHVKMERTLNLGGGGNNNAQLLEMQSLGGGADPPDSPKPASFEDLISKGAWEEYCSAFETFD